jgi:PAS domain-containing protein
MEPELGALHFAVACGGVVLGIAAALWAVAERRAARLARRHVKGLAARARAALALRDALLSEGRDALVTWDRKGRSSACYRDADMLLRNCLEGADGAGLSADVEALHDRGRCFTRAARDRAGRKYVIRGRTAGGSVAIWIESESEAAAEGVRLAALLNAVPVPIWLRDAALSLQWANRAFLSAVGAETIEDARNSQAGFDGAVRQFAAAALSRAAPRETERFALIDGAWHSFALTHVPLEDGAVAGTAIDMSRSAESEVLLKRHLQNQAHLLDRLKIALAVFGADRRLDSHNAAFAELWRLDPKWLATRPAHEELLDRLREARKLPERRNYQTWRRQRMALYGDPEGHAEETWPLPDGKTLRVGLSVNPTGGAVVLYENVTEKFALESSLKTLVAAQSATLDVLGEGVAVFGPDGRLALHNAAFAEIWDLDRTMLAPRPHIRAVAEACLAKFGDDAMWERLVATVSSSPTQRRNWRKLHRADGVVLSLATVPLPSRATLVTFADVTDASRIETALRERNDALETVNRMRADYIKHLSYELRTPLNTILGFAEHLTAGKCGTLPGDLREPLEAIVSGSYDLKTVVDEMLAGLVDADAAARRDAVSAVASRAASGPARAAAVAVPRRRRHPDSRN